MKRPIAIKRLIWTIPIATIVLLVPTALVLAATGEGGFDGVVDSLETQYHSHATRIPMMGLVSLVAGAATRDGVRSLHVAEFEHFSAPVDGQELKQMVEKKLGPGWELMVRETSRKGGDQTLIYCHPEGKRMGLFIIDRDHNELDVVQVSVDPDHLNESIGKWDHQGPHHSSDAAVED
jgi:hypothetical protein